MMIPYTPTTAQLTAACAATTVAQPTMDCERRTHHLRPIPSPAAITCRVPRRRPDCWSLAASPCRTAPANDIVCFCPVQSFLLSNPSDSLSAPVCTYLSQQLPCPADSLLLEIVPKGPVAQHLKEGVVVHVLANIIKVIVLATCTAQHSTAHVTAVAAVASMFVLPSDAAIQTVLTPLLVFVLSNIQPLRVLPLHPCWWPCCCCCRCCYRCCCRCYQRRRCRRHRSFC